MDMKDGLGSIQTDHRNAHLGRLLGCRSDNPHSGTSMPLRAVHPIFLGRLGISVGGKTTRLVREQAERISRCRLTFHAARRGGSVLLNQNIVDVAMFVDDTGEYGQGSLFVETARLSETFFQQLKQHAVPLDEAAIRHIRNSSMALDVYCWLAYRLHALTAPKAITWAALAGQFGAGIKLRKHFKPAITEGLGLAQAVYRDARIAVTETGMILKPSPPPVRKLAKQG